MGGEYIKERILLILVLLIFFTSLGSAAATSDIASENLTSDVFDESDVLVSNDVSSDVESSAIDMWYSSV